MKPERRTVLSGGIKRNYTVVSPENPSGVVIFFHGSTQSGNVLRRFTDNTFDRFADKGLAVVYPDGVARHWNDARATLPEKTRDLGTDDVQFTKDILAELGAKDDQPIYFVGYSNGGQMVLRLLHDIPGRCAAAAVIAATQPEDSNFLCASDSFVPTPILFMHGTLDKLVPFDGGVAGPRAEKARGDVMGFEASLDYYAEKNGAEFEREVLLASNDSQTITQLDFAGHVPVRGIKMEGVGHVIPTLDTVTSPHIGPATTLIVAAEVIDEFFSSLDADGRTR